MAHNIYGNELDNTNDSLKQSKKHFELSFGQSLLFISHSKQTNIITNTAIVIPTNAMLFLAEFRPDKILRIPVFFNLATESKQFLINGQLVNERASPTIGTGCIVKIMDFKINEKSKLEFEFGPLLSCLFTTKNAVQFAPVLAARLKVLRGENFIMYLGSSYSFGINALGLLYGTGTIF
ncbi:MAG TPA: hypothetical protein PK323_11350 [Bacteroidia bacterium]|nr:hypothetical protein [Bacteroidia bacterium]